jgi:hypothetical protein
MSILLFAYTPHDKKRGDVHDKQSEGDDPEHRGDLLVRGDDQGHRCDQPKDQLIEENPRSDIHGVILYDNGFE